MITRPRIWLVCDDCKEWFAEKDAKEKDVCPDCKKGKLWLSCAECGELRKNCKCEGEELKRREDRERV